MCGLLDCLKSLFQTTHYTGPADAGVSAFNPSPPTPRASNGQRRPAATASGHTVVRINEPPLTGVSVPRLRPSRSSETSPSINLDSPAHKLQPHFMSGTPQDHLRRQVRIATAPLGLNAQLNDPNLSVEARQQGEQARALLTSRIHNDEEAHLAIGLAALAASRIGVDAGMRRSAEIEMASPREGAYRLSTATTESSPASVVSPVSAVSAEDLGLPGAHSE